MNRAARPAAPPPALGDSADPARVVDARPFGKLDTWSSRYAGPPPFKLGQMVEIQRRSPLGMFVMLAGIPGYWRADRFQPVNPEKA